MASNLLGLSIVARSLYRKRLVRVATSGLAVIGLIKLKSSIRNRQYLTAKSLVGYERSAWKHLYQNGDDKAFLNTMGVTRAVFHYILEGTHDKLSCPRKRSRLDPQGILGLVLHYLNSVMGQKSLCLIFGIPPATLCRNLHFGLAVLEEFLKLDTQARVEFPTPEEFDNFSEQMARRHPKLRNVVGFLDGTTFRVQEPGHPGKQAQYYNGWKHCTTVTNMFAFLPDGTICYSKTNCPGSMHDATVATRLFGLLEERVPEPYRFVADSAFAYHEKILRPLKQSQVKSIPREQLYDEIQLHKAITSVRQAAEWGMRALKGAFARLKTPLSYNDNFRRCIIHCCVRLYNLRTRLVGINQIRTVYSEDWSPAITGSHDRVLRYYNILY